jgi:hypothetical protein
MTVEAICPEAERELKGSYFLFAIVPPIMAIIVLNIAEDIFESWKH